MTEFEKMRSEEFYTYCDPEVYASVMRANQLCAKLQSLTIPHPDYRGLINELVPGIPESSFINPPFNCDHGHGIRLGENVFVNYGCIMLDGGLITIGNNTQIGPGCRLVTPNHPMNYIERRKPQECCHPITIGEDCWLGAGVVVCPGVKIGNRCVIGAGSVVVKDIPDDSLAVGNPAHVVRTIPH